MGWVRGGVAAIFAQFFGKASERQLIRMFSRSGERGSLIDSASILQRRFTVTSQPKSRRRTSIHLLTTKHPHLPQPIFCSFHSASYTHTHTHYPTRCTIHITHPHISKNREDSLPHTVPSLEEAETTLIHFQLTLSNLFSRPRILPLHLIHPLLMRFRRQHSSPEKRLILLYIDLPAHEHVTLTIARVAHITVCC